MQRAGSSTKKRARKRSAGSAAKGAGSRKRTAKKSDRARSGTGARKWSSRVTERSNALDLDSGVFTWRDPRRIAASLKRSAERSRRRRTTPFQSAMSMLTFYINRAGRDLGAEQRRVLERAKDELRSQFGRA